MLQTPVQRGVAKTLFVVFLLAFVGLLGGCSTSQTLDAYQDENTRLHAELARAWAALDDERNRSATYQMQIEDLMRRLEAQPAPSEADSGFNDLTGVDVIMSDTSVTLRIPGDVLFAPGRVELKPEMQATLNQIASTLQSQYPSNIIRVEGYTDTDPISRSGWDDNLELSLQRAAAVHRHLASRGIQSSRMYAAGYGAERPLATKEASRRVEIVVLLNQ